MIRTRTAIFALLLSLGPVAESSAQRFISPFVGFDFGGHLRCWSFAVTGGPRCSQMLEREDKNLNIGASFGGLGNLLGTELEIAYASKSLEEVGRTSSSFLTIMGNVMLVPRIGPARPYALGGIGLLQESVEFTAAAVSEDTGSHFGWNVGGGLIGSWGEHIGLRGDIRYFRTFRDAHYMSGLGNVPGTKSDFTRVSGGIVFKF